MVLIANESVLKVYTKATQYSITVYCLILPFFLSFFLPYFVVGAEAPFYGGCCCNYNKCPADGALTQAP